MPDHDLYTKQGECLTTLTHFYPPLTLADIAANATHDATHNTTGHESLPRLLPATRVPGPLPQYVIAGLATDFPFADDDHEEAANAAHDAPRRHRARRDGRAMKSSRHAHSVA